MKDLYDAYGHALCDYLHEKGRGYEVLERSDGYVDISGGREIYLAEYPRWPAHQRQAIRYAKGRVLDVGCGAGRHALYLQRKGLDVLGIFRQADGLAPRRDTSGQYLGSRKAHLKLQQRGHIPPMASACPVLSSSNAPGVVSARTSWAGFNATVR